MSAALEIMEEIQVTLLLIVIICLVNGLIESMMEKRRALVVKRLKNAQNVRCKAKKQIPGAIVDIDCEMNEKNLHLQAQRKRIIRS